MLPLFHTNVRRLQKEREEQIERREGVSALRGVSRRRGRRARGRGRWNRRAPHWLSTRRRKTGLVTMTTN
jgi:hypothetical protein